MGQLKYKRYVGSVEYSEEDNCLYGKVLGMSNDLISYEGQTVDELKKDFEGAVEDYLTSCNDRGIKPRKSFSGKLNLRMSSELHGRVAAIATKTGTTINEFINKAIANELEHV
ncbi:MAG: type II toxin-antitoxin system HicB family antitoxin [Proteiniphilum sp.]|jgi:predicted HicB family RNase H-like nuclease|uniref:type II toxin-antitoxin system HicB family antitoxin n=1 Tax=Proteiniphilum sp. TaxID=1926877 RepID=UPI002B212D34|nr:type II toxin-antitoxin system HicB family antitoxin [Proteiniphilum sp.]MEA5129674.1 type II toxin-antitoxin system HicB family antitoxin [Proteiniphilum sp.]